MTLLTINNVERDIHTLGPGPAAVIWTQGCARNCPGCASPHTFDPEGGRQVEVRAAAQWLHETGLRHLTLSGGEPADQPAALIELITTIRRQRDWTVTMYTGHTLEALRADRPAGSAALLSHLDLLIDGPYVRRHHASLLWRGSTNQRIHDLTARVPLPPDESAGITTIVDADGSFRLVGVYPEPDVADRLVAALGLAEVPVHLDRPRTLPIPAAATQET